MNDCVGIYVITNTLTGKRYIGQSKACNKRFKQHKSSLMTQNDHHHKSFIDDFRHFGEGAFICEIIEDYTYMYQPIYTAQQYGMIYPYQKQLEYNIQKILDDREQYYIKLYNSIVPNGYNVMYGGKLNVNGCCDDFREQQRRKTKLYWESLSEEEREKRSECLRNLPRNFEYIKSDEYRRRCSERTKIRWSNLSEEERRRLSEARSKRTLKYYEDHDTSAKIRCIQTDETMTVREAIARYKRDSSSLYKCLNGKIKHWAMDPETGEFLSWERI